VARLSAESKVRQGEEAELWFDASHLQLFDLDSGRSLLADGAGSGTAPQQPPPQTQQQSTV
jgi:hypothetical protein